MSQLEEVYIRLTESKARASEIKKMLTDELTHHPKHAELKDKIKELRIEIKAIENDVHSATQSEMDEYDQLKSEIMADTELLADIVLNMYISGEPVEIVDQHNEKWFPKFKVAFKKS